MFRVFFGFLCVWTFYALCTFHISVSWLCYIIPKTQRILPDTALRIHFFIYCRLFVLILVVFCVVSSFTTFRPNFTSDLLQVILPRPRIGMMSLVTVSLVITAFHSFCLSHHIFDQVNLWPAWVGFETAIFWQCSPGTGETQRLHPLRHGPRRAIKDGFFGLINPYLVFHSRVRTEFL